MNDDLKGEIDNFVHKKFIDYIAIDNSELYVCLNNVIKLMKSETSNNNSISDFIELSMEYYFDDIVGKYDISYLIFDRDLINIEKYIKFIKYMLPFELNFDVLIEIYNTNIMHEEYVCFPHSDLLVIPIKHSFHELVKNKFYDKLSKLIDETYMQNIDET
jgi:hypothetical protein